MDAKDTQPRKFDGTGSETTASASGSAWAELDETFFRIVAGRFPHSFCAGARTCAAPPSASPAC